MKTKVLIVDDEVDFLEVMGERLAVRGMVVETSSSAAEALKKVDAEPFDAVILDLKMPGMDGLEALNLIKAKRPDCQVILLTGHATVEKGVAAIKGGAMDFIEKPADLEAIADKIKRAKEKRMLIVEKASQERDHGNFETPRVLTRRDPPDRPPGKGLRFSASGPGIEAFWVISNRQASAPHSASLNSSFLHETTISSGGPLEVQPSRRERLPP